MKAGIHTHLLPSNWPDLRERYRHGGFTQLDVHDGCGRRMKDGELFRAVVESTSFSAATKDRLLSGTVLEWLGLNRPGFETDASRAHTLSL